MFLLEGNISCKLQLELLASIYNDIYNRLSLDILIGGCHITYSNILRIDSYRVRSGYNTLTWCVGPNVLEEFTASIYRVADHGSRAV
jgi:hypothetical protein